MLREVVKMRSHRSLILSIGVVCALATPIAWKVLQAQHTKERARQLQNEWVELCAERDKTWHTFDDVAQGPERLEEKSRRRRDIERRMHDVANQIESLTGNRPSRVPDFPKGAFDNISIDDTRE